MAAGHILLRRRDQKRLTRGHIELREIPGALFVDGPRATDARQGTIGDCYLLCAFSAVARARPQSFLSMVRQSYNGSFQYTVSFYRRMGDGNFKPELVTIDGKIPFDVKNGRPLYARTLPDVRGQIETWPMILEKAYAKWKGGYNIVGEGGAVEDTLEELTGKPTRMLYMAEHHPEILWKMLTTATRENWPATICTYGRVERPGLDELGLHPNHIHIFLGAHTWRGRRIVWIRDPFDRPTCGKLVLPDLDGVFTLSWENFLNYFAEIHINSKTIFDIPSPPYPSVSIRQALERSYVFRTLDLKTKREMAADFKVISIPVGQPVFKSGSPPDFYYLIKSGTAGVEVVDKKSGRRLRVAVLNAGDQFGEMALINHAVRLADVIAITPLRLCRMPAPQFQKWISRHPELVTRFRRRFELQVGMQKWSHRPITSVSLDTLLEAGKQESYRKNRFIFRQGETADAFYVLLDGKVDVVVKIPGRPLKRVKVLESGDIFGEGGALQRAPRTASVRALSHVKVLKLDITATANLMESFEVMQRQLEFITRRRANRLKKLHRAS